MSRLLLGGASVILRAHFCQAYEDAYGSPFWSRREVSVQFLEFPADPILILIEQPKTSTACVGGASKSAIWLSRHMG